MSYTKTNWNNNTAPYIDDTNLNHIEQGIFNNDSAITALNTRIDNLSTGMPVGSGCDYFGTTLPSEDFMWADGSAISRTTYAELFAIIGTTYGAGDGSTTFNLPDKRTRVSVMRQDNDDTFANLGATGGEKKHTLTTAEMPSHSHTVERGNASGTTVWAPIAPNGGMTDKKVNLTTSSVGSGTAHNILQPYLVCNYIIKVR